MALNYLLEVQGVSIRVESGSLESCLPLFFLPLHPAQSSEILVEFGSVRLC